MEDVAVSSFKMEAQDKLHPEDSFPADDGDSNLAKINWTCTQQKRPDGAGRGNVTGGWNAIGNQVHS